MFFDGLLAKILQSNSRIFDIVWQTQCIMNECYHNLPYVLLEKHVVILLQFV